MQTTSSSQKNYRLLFYFILAWLLMNMLQACFLGLDGDEAYYWVYSRHLQWGYFDHPPMVALSIKLGELFGHGWLFTRLGAILFSAATVYFGFKALPERLQKTKEYIFVFASVVFFHIYGFVTTPDAPLLFFTALFFYAYKRYLEKENVAHVLFLAFSIVGMIYSKYHGVLPVFFTLLSNPKLVLRRSAWIVMILATAAFLPHLWWQYQNDWPTVRYHLFERSQGSYKIEKTANYILGQLLILGPFTTIVTLVLLVKKRTRGDVYFRAHVFTFFGILIFFLLNSFKKNIEPHWTLTAAISFVVLTLDLLERSTDKFKTIFFRLAAANIVLLLLVRVLLAIPNTPAKNLDRFQVQVYSQSWADSLYKKAAGTPVVFVDNYHYPSIYAYYHPDQLSTSYSTVYYRKSTYTFQNGEAFNNKTVYIVRQSKMADGDIEVKSSYVPTFLHKVDSFKAVSGLKISWLNPLKEASKNNQVTARIELSNPMNYSIDGKNLFLNYTFFKSKSEFKTSENIPLSKKELLPGYKKTVDINISFPIEPGTYRLIFSFDQPWLGPTFASPFYEVEVK
ncbi:MAG: glycosyltransferase family 39 protein [Flavisolibacter sp.]|nr:glycosyltransferase family 39 protein [Flavisolibacter sp.]